ncbi:MAG: HDOD domain-containing protein [Methylocystaceae bacterium]
MGILTVEQVVSQVKDLPTLPEVAIEVIKLTDDPNATAQDINRVVGKDQGLTAKVLKLANSAYYGFPRRIATVTEATVLLGFQTVRSIVMAASVSDMLSREVQGYSLASGELWRHSQATAMGARLLARQCKYPASDVAYTAGLLHDIGKVILNHYLEEAYQPVVETVTREGVMFMEAETAILGFNHAEIGARVGEKWNLPLPLVEAIANHHSPQLATIDPRLTAIIHLADCLTMIMGVGLGVDGLFYGMQEDALQKLGLTTENLEDLVSRLTDMMVDASAFLG